MKQFLFVLTLVALLTSCGGNSEYIDIVDALDVNNPDNTSMNIKTAWSEMKGRMIELDGEVVDIKGGRSSAEVFVAVDGKPLYRNYNVVIKTYDLGTAGKVKRGDNIDFSGELYTYKQRRGNPLVLVLNNGRIKD